MQTRGYTVYIVEDDQSVRDALGLLLGLRGWWREQERRKQLAGGYLPKPRFEGKVIKILAK